MCTKARQMDACGDASPCRWAAMFNDVRSDSETQLMDLSPREQRARGQVLLRLLWEPFAPEDESMPSAESTPVQSHRDASEPRQIASEVNVHIKNTFIQEGASLSRQNLKRSNSDSALLSGSINVTFDDEVAIIPAFGHSSKMSFTGATLVQEEEASGRQKPETLTLSACLCVHEGDHSEASTETPRDSIEDLSNYEACDALLMRDLAPEEFGDRFQPHSFSTGRSDYNVVYEHCYTRVGSECEHHPEIDVFRNFVHAPQYESRSTTWSQNAMPGVVTNKSDFLGSQFASNACQTFGHDIVHTPSATNNIFFMPMQQHDAYYVALDASSGSSHGAANSANVGGLNVTPLWQWTAAGAATTCDSQNVDVPMACF